MKVLNFGSLNIDYVYQMAHFIRPGETAPCKTLTAGCGGKGLNQSIALAKAGTSYMLVEQDWCYDEGPFECLRRSYEHVTKRFPETK